MGHFGSLESGLEEKSNLIFMKTSFPNMKLEEQLSVKALLILIIFEKLYLLNSCLIFDGSFQVSSDSYERNNYAGLISDQNYTSG